MDFQGLELNSREAARRPLPFDILKRATRCQKKIKSLFDIFICIHAMTKTSNSTANAFLLVRGDVTFVWESVRNHVIVIV